MFSEPSLCLLQELLKSFKGLDSVQRSDGGDLSMHGRARPLSLQGTCPTLSTLQVACMCALRPTLLHAPQVLYQTASIAVTLT